MKAASATKRLMLLRHGHAARSQPGESDLDRALDPRGSTEAERLGAFLARHQLMPDLVIVSTAVRARQTWARVAAAAGQGPAPRHDARLYDAKPETLLALLKEATARSVLVVGHNPALHELAMLLIASGDVEDRERLHEDFPTGGLVVIDFALDSWSKLHPQSGRLELFIAPASLDTTVD